MKKLNLFVTTITMLFLIASCSKDSSTTTTSGNGCATGAESMSYKVDGVLQMMDTMYYGGANPCRIVGISKGVEVFKIYVFSTLSKGTSKTFYFAGPRSTADSALGSLQSVGLIESGALDITISSDDKLCGSFSGPLKVTSNGSIKQITEGKLVNIDSKY